MQASEILYKAADLIETKGWTKTVFTQDGAYCAVGAMRKIAWGTVDYVSDGDDFWEALHCLIQRVGPVYAWNDTHAKDKEEVISTLREVAKSCE